MIMDARGSKKMLYTRKKENSKFFEALTLKNISIGLFVSVLGGFILAHGFKFWKSSATKAVEVRVDDSARVFDDSENDAILRKPAIRNSIVSNFENKDYKFFLYDKQPFCALSQVKLAPTLEVKTEELKRTRMDLVDQNIIEINRSPQFTADGNSFVYCRKYRNSIFYGLFLMKINESGTAKPYKRITTVWDCSYSLTPDGNGIVYTKMASGALNNAIYRINLDGTNETLLVNSTTGIAYSNPIILNFKNANGVVVERLYFKAGSVKYLDLNAESPRQENFPNDIPFQDQYFWKLCPQAIGSNDDDGRFLVTKNERMMFVCSSVGMNCVPMNSNLPNSFGSGNIHHAILDKDGTTVYYLQTKAVGSALTIVKNNIQGNAPQDLVTVPHLINHSFSMRPDHADGMDGSADI